MLVLLRDLSVTEAVFLHHFLSVVADLRRGEQAGVQEFLDNGGSGTLINASEHC